MDQLYAHPLCSSADFTVMEASRSSDQLQVTCVCVCVRAYTCTWMLCVSACIPAPLFCGSPGFGPSAVLFTQLGSSRLSSSCRQSRSGEWTLRRMGRVLGLGSTLPTIYIQLPTSGLQFPEVCESNSACWCFFGPLRDNNCPHQWHSARVKEVSIITNQSIIGPSHNLFSYFLLAFCKRRWTPLKLYIFYGWPMMLICICRHDKLYNCSQLMRMMQSWHMY